MLFDIESTMHKYLRFFDICKEVDRRNVQTIISKIKIQNRELLQIAHKEEEE